MEIAAVIVTPVVNALTVHITQKLRYITSSADLVEEMGKQMKVLEGQRTDNKKKMRSNRASSLETPARVPEWLDEVDEIMKKVHKILPGIVASKSPASTSTSDVEDVQEGSAHFPSNDLGCFDVKNKYRAGRDAFRLTKYIKDLIEESNKMIWSDTQIPLGRVDSKHPTSPTTSSSGGNTQTGFKSRDKIFNDALKFLQDDGDKTQVIALCGMGGVGKTTLMKQLKEAAKDKKMFNWIVEVGIGKTPNLLAIQKAIAEHIREPLTRTDETLMATYLSKRFEVLSEKKEKCLVILDDVWRESKIKLEDIGLARPLPKGVKLLLTSRDENICQQIAVEADSDLQVVRVDVLEEGEARDFFSRITGISEEHDCDLYKIGCDIVKKCGCLPLAIKLIAATLKCQKAFVWRHTLDRLKINDLDEDVQKIVEISYTSLKQEDKAIFLLCCLFPEDSNIPIEDLTRYAWGLKLLKQVFTMGNARDSTQTSVSNLKNAYLLMDGDGRHTECVKMHDLVLSFAVATVSKGGDEGCWIVNHDDFSEWREDVHMRQSYKRISLACKGMSDQFLSEFKFPNLSLLKLMHGNESLRVPLDFYEGMKELQVIAFQKLQYPVVPTSYQCSTNLRTLCLDECSLMFDLSCIGNLSNLEVLSFANSGITILPYTFGNLKKLRVLDATGCYNLVMDDGVLKNMVKLEELYMIVVDKMACCFTDTNCKEFAEHSEKLSALEFEFIGNTAHLKNMSFKKLNRFKLSVGCSSTEVRDNVQTNHVDIHSYQNSLKLVTNREELLTSKINELFKKTNALYLQVNDMNTLEDIDMEPLHPRHPPQNSSFYNLRFLVVLKCVNMRYLFTLDVATSLSKLEYLDISNCPMMEVVIHTENDGSDMIKFSNLKYLRLDWLPKLLSFSNNVNVIELPSLVELKLNGLPSITSIYPSSASSSVSSIRSRVHSLFHEEVANPKLEKLFVFHMDSLTEIWSPNSQGNLFLLRELTVVGCSCIEVLINMYFGKLEQLSSSLRSIRVEGCYRLVKLFSCNPFPILNNLQELRVSSCGSIQVLFDIDSGRVGNIGEQVLSSSLRSIRVERCDSLVKLFSCNPFPILNNLQELGVSSCGSIQVLFDIDSGRADKSEEKIFSSSLRSIQVLGCDSLVNLFSGNPFPFFNNLQELDVRKCGSIQVLFNTDLGRACKSEEQVCTSSLKSIIVSECDSLVNLLPSNPMPLFKHLEKLEVSSCVSVEVIFDIDMGCVGETNEVSRSSSRLRSIRLEMLGKLREVWKIKDSGNNVIHGFETVENVYIDDCVKFENLITPATTNLDMRALKQVEISRCGRESERKNEMVESKQHQEINVISSSREEVNDVIYKVALPSYLLHTFHHLHKLALWKCKAVEVVFDMSSSRIRESSHNTQQALILPYLEELGLYNLEMMSHVWKCNWNEFSILQKPQSQSSFHNLTTIKMYDSNNIKYLFSPLMAKLLSNLKRVDIWSCDGIEEVVSNRDDVDASEYSHTTTTFFPHLDILNFYRLNDFKCVGGGANAISTDIHDQLKLSQSPWSLCQYAREIIIKNCDALSSVIPWYAAGQMQKLQVLEIINCKSMKEVFETQEINNKSGIDNGKSLPRVEYIMMLKLPKLKILKIHGCPLLKYIFKIFTLESLTELEELEIKDCKAMEVIVNKEIGEQNTSSNVVVFPRLKSLALVNLPTIVGFFLGKNEFTWPRLEKVVISECPQITVFTYGRSTTPKLNFIDTSLGKHSVECGLNFHVKTTSHQARLLSYESTSAYRPTTMERLPWSYHNLIEVDMCNPSGGSETLFTSDKLLQLQKLEIVHFKKCEDTEEIFEVFDSQIVAEIPNLRQVELESLDSLKYMWKSKQGTVLKFPNLTRLSIEMCRSLEYVFTCSMLRSILQLQELHIKGCSSMKVIVKGEEERDAIVNATVVLVCLKSLKLEFLNSLEGFCIGNEAFEFPSLDTLEIFSCHKMTVFTKGDLSAPKLYAISSKWDGKYNIHNRLNSFMNTSPSL